MNTITPALNPINTNNTINSPTTQPLFSNPTPPSNPPISPPLCGLASFSLSTSNSSSFPQSSLFSTNFDEFSDPAQLNQLFSAQNQIIITNDHLLCNDTLHDQNHSPPLCHHHYLHPSTFEPLTPTHGTLSSTFPRSAQHSHSLINPILSDLSLDSSQTDVSRFLEHHRLPTHHHHHQIDVITQCGDHHHHLLHTVVCNDASHEEGLIDEAPTTITGASLCCEHDHRDNDTCTDAAHSDENVATEPSPQTQSPNSAEPTQPERINLKDNKTNDFPQLVMITSTSSPTHTETHFGQLDDSCNHCDHHKHTAGEQCDNINTPHTKRCANRKGSRTSRAAQQTTRLPTRAQRAALGLDTEYGEQERLSKLLLEQKKKALADVEGPIPPPPLFGPGSGRGRKKGQLTKKQLEQRRLKEEQAERERLEILEKEQEIEAIGNNIDNYGPSNHHDSNHTTSNGFNYVPLTTLQQSTMKPHITILSPLSDRQNGGFTQQTTAMGDGSTNSINLNLLQVIKQPPTITQPCPMVNQSVLRTCYPTTLNVTHNKPNHLLNNPSINIVNNNPSTKLNTALACPPLNANCCQLGVFPTKPCIIPSSSLPSSLLPSTSAPKAVSLHPSQQSTASLLQTALPPRSTPTTAAFTSNLLKSNLSSFGQSRPVFSPATTTGTTTTTPTTSSLLPTIIQNPITAPHTTSLPSTATTTPNDNTLHLTCHGKPLNTISILQNIHPHHPQNNTINNSAHMITKIGTTNNGVSLNNTTASGLQHTSIKNDPTKSALRTIPIPTNTSFPLQSPQQPLQNQIAAVFPTSNSTSVDSSTSMTVEMYKQLLLQQQEIIKHQQSMLQQFFKTTSDTSN